MAKKMTKKHPGGDLGLISDAIMDPSLRLNFPKQREGVSNINTLNNLSKVVEEQCQEARRCTQLSRNALAEVDRTLPLTTETERIVEVASQHQVAMMKLSATTAAPHDEKELEYWVEVLITSRRFLNNLIKGAV